MISKDIEEPFFKAKLSIFLSRNSMSSNACGLAFKKGVAEASYRVSLIICT
jgi:hypothetical protein